MVNGKKIERKKEATNFFCRKYHNYKVISSYSNKKKSSLFFSITWFPQPTPIFKPTNHRRIFFFLVSCKKSIRGFQPVINVDIVISLIKEVNWDFSARSITFTNHFSVVDSVRSPHFWAYNNLAAVVIYKIEALWLISSCLSINPKRTASGFNCI